MTVGDGGFSGFTGSASSVEIAQVARAFGQIPKELQRSLRPALADAGNGVLRDAAIRASAWSVRIPHAIELRVSFASRRPGVYLRVNQKIAPHARPFEGILGNTFRHPVYGGDSAWVVQRARPYLLPAARAGGASVRAAVANAVNLAQRAAGF